MFDNITFIEDGVKMFSTYDKKVEGLIPKLPNKQYLWEKSACPMLIGLLSKCVGQYMWIGGVNSKLPPMVNVSVSFCQPSDYRVTI